MNFRVRLGFLVLLFLLSLLRHGSTSGRDAVAVPASGVFEDSRVARWSADFLAGRRDQMLAAVEDDLRSESPHPLAASVWVAAHELRNELKESWDGLADAKVRAALGQAPRVKLKYAEGGHRELIQEFPPDEAEKITNLLVLQVLQSAAGECVDLAAYGRYAMAEARLTAGSSFNAAWNLLWLVTQDERVRLEVLGVIQPGREFEKTPMGEFLRPLVGQRTSGAHDHLAAVDLFLKRVPGDAKAHRFRAIQLSGLERYEEAAAAYGRADTAYSFLRFWVDQATALVQAGDIVAARKVVAERQPSECKPAEVEARTQAALAGVLRGAGEKGQSRAVLSAALARWPQDPQLLYQLAGLEIADGRHSAAVDPARRAALLKPDAAEYHARAVVALRDSGQLDEAWAAFERAGKLVRFPSRQLFAVGVDTLERQKRWDDEIALCDRYFTAFPASTDTFFPHSRAYALNGAGRTIEAIDVLRAAFAQQPPSAWAINRYREWLTASADKATADRELVALRTRYPWHQPLWEDSAGQCIGSTRCERQIALWREAIAANPAAHWPYRRLMDVMAGERMWDEAEQVTTDSLAAASRDGSLHDRSEATFNHAIVSVLKLRSQRLDSTALETALARFEKYEQGGGYTAACHQYRSEVLEAMGRKRDAAKAFFEAAKLRPDDGGLAWDLVTRYAPELGQGTVLSHLHRVADRDPYNGDKLKKVVHVHTMWYGSPIVALRWIEEMRERAPDAINKGHEAMCRGKLGDHAFSYRVQYSQDSSISPSDRYVGWWESSRREAQAGTCHVDIDYKAGLARITHPDGQVELRRDHPVSGKRELLQVGPAFIKCEYDPIGDNLLRITSSSGAEVRVTYTPDKQINTISTSQGDELSFKYNPAGKPTQMALKGVGALDVTYTPDNQIDKVKTVGGPDALQRIRAAHDTYQNLVETIGTTLGVDAPDLPFKDATLDGWRVAYQKEFDAYIADAEPDSRARRLPAVLDAGLKLAEHLVAHVAERRQYVAEARAILTRIFESAIDVAAGDLKVGPKPQPNDPMSDRAVRAAEQWRRLMLAVRPDGLAGSEWDQWLRMREWLNVQVRQGEAVAASALLAADDKQPLELLKSSQWLSRSYLDNPGYWRRFQADELVPRPLSDGVTLNAVLVRDNHHVVVGTSRGLSVLRRGHWEWFVFDELAGRFTNSPAKFDAKATSDVLSLAEDVSGGLWVGTANGLFRLAGEYDGPVTARRLREDGLPVPRVDRLAASGSGVLAGTSVGLVAFPAEDARQADGAEGKVVNEVVPAIPPGLASEAVLALRTWTVKPPPGEEPNERAAALELEALLGESTSKAGSAASTLPAVGTQPATLPAKAPSTPVSPATFALVANRTALWALVAGRWSKLCDGQFDDALWSSVDGKVFLLRGGELYALDWDGSSTPPGVPQRVRGQQNIQKAHKIYALAPLPIDARGVTVGTAVLTDQGLSIYHQGHFEHKRLPLTDKMAAAYAVATADRRTYVLSSEGIFALEAGQVMGDSGGERVYDLLTSEGQGVTFVARGTRLEAVRHIAVAEGAKPFDFVKSTHLALDAQDRLVTNDGLQIVRYDVGTTRAKELFRVEQSAVPGEWGNGKAPLRSLIVASDATIWAAAGPSLFRWREGMDKPQEFSIFIDPVRFPANSEMISRVIETLDGQIWVVASWEVHLTFKGMQLDGGVLQWTGDGFKRAMKGEADDSKAGGWFASSYTQVDGDTAIIGTSDGFVRHRGNSLVTFDDLKDGSYAQLKRHTPQLWLGTRGAKLGQDLWLFGTAGGVVAYQRGIWIYPDRLNWMLPDHHLASYGALAVHAVATDKAGHIYAGTDRGLLVYDAGGADSAAFLMSNGSEVGALCGAEHEKLQREADDMIGSILKSNAEGPLAQQIRRVRDLRAEIRKSQLAVGPGRTLAPPATPPMQPGAREQLEKALVEKEKALKRELQQMEFADRAVHQLLELKPLDLAALREKISSDQVFVQYMPTPHRLYIHLVSRHRHEIRVVEVDRERLEETAIRTARVLAARRTPIAATRPAASSATGPAEREPKRGMQWAEVPVVVDPIADRAWLYDQLIRPIEPGLASFKHVFVVPVGSLCYVPFGALVRSTQPQIEYAVERFNFGYVPSLYIFDLVYGQRTSSLKDSLILGDPDGTLPGAKAETKAVYDIVRGDLPPRSGRDASAETLRSLAHQAKIVHIASHGVLNPQQPWASYILLFGADRPTRFSMEDASELDLKKADLVVLSACETGIGGNGAEYATLARAFARAGSPATVATLWRVEDEASLRLMSGFYKNLRAGDDVFTAMTKAQRAIVKGDPKYRSPSLWAGYIPLGKPSTLWESDSPP